MVFDNTGSYNTDTLGFNVRTLANTGVTASSVIEAGGTFRVLGSNTADTVQNVLNGGFGSGIEVDYAGNTIEVRSGTGSSPQP